MSMFLGKVMFAFAGLLASANRHSDLAEYGSQEGFEARLSASMKESRFLKGQMICGSTKIKQALNSGADNLPWTSIMELADNYIAQQTAGLQAKQDQIEKAQAALTRAFETESVPEISSSVEKLKELFGPVFQTYDAVNGEQYMIDSNCGSARIEVNGKKKHFAKAFDLSVAAFKESLAKNSGQFTMQQSEVTRRTCLAILHKEQDAGDTRSMCKLFCDEVAHIGREVTSAASAAKGDSAELQAKLQLLGTEVEAMMALREDCESSKKELLTFQSKLGGLTDDIAENRRKFTSFNQEADETRFDLEDLSEEAEKQRLLIARLLDVLRSASLDQQGLEGKVSKLQKEYAELSETLEVTSSLLAHTMQEVDKATLAANTVQDLQARLTAVLLQINIVFDQTIRSSISKMGFGPTASIKDMFPTVGNVPEVNDAIRNFIGFCNEPATKTSFQLADEAVSTNEFGSMCHLPVTGEEVAKSISKIVQDRVNRLVELLESVKSWTDPFKGTQRNTHEIEGLRNVIAIYSNSPYSHDPFYFEYLRKWKTQGKGSHFPELVDKLATALATEKNAAGELQRSADSLQATITELHASLDLMQTELASAIEAAKAAGRDVAEAEAVQRTLDEQQAAMQAKLADFEANAREAEEAMEQARAELVNTHASAISLVEKFDNAELAGELKQVSHH